MGEITDITFYIPVLNINCIYNYTPYQLHTIIFCTLCIIYAANYMYTCVENSKEQRTKKQDENLKRDKTRTENMKIKLKKRTYKTEDDI